jgi:hypothetical protein
MWENVSKKNMFEFARPVVLHYIIGYLKDNQFHEVKKEKLVFKPKHLVISEISTSIHGYDKKKAEKKGQDPETIMKKLKGDLKNVNVIVSHSLSFHLKALQVECFRTCVDIDFSNYLLIDIMSFYHKKEYPKLKDLSKEYLKKDFSDKKSSYNLVIIKKIFLKLYKEYEKECLA